MAVAELPLPPFPYEKDFFGSPFPKGGKKSALPIFGKKSNKENQMDEQEKKLKKYSEHLTKHLRLRQRIVFKNDFIRNNPSDNVLRELKKSTLFSVGKA